MAGIYNKLAVYCGKKKECSKLRVPLCPVNSLLKGLSLHAAGIKRISPWLV